MRLSFPMSIPTLPRVDFSNIYVISDYLIDLQSEIVGAALSVQSRGGKVFQFGGKHVVPGAKIFAWGMNDFDRLCSLGIEPYGVAIIPEDECKGKNLLGEDWHHHYEEAATDKRVSAIAVCSGHFELSRLGFFSSLVHEKKFCFEKPHWLYGFHNPGEIAAFRYIFAPFVTSCIDVAVCSSSFIYSVYGVALSVHSGIYMPIPMAYPSRVFDLGMEPWLKYELCREQLRLFQLNTDTVQSFAQGINRADGYVEWVRDSLSL